MAVLPEDRVASAEARHALAGDQCRTQGQAPVRQEAPQARLLVSRVVQRLGDRRAVEREFGLRLAPLEECVDDLLRLLRPHRLPLLPRRARDRLLDLEEPLQEPDMRWEVTDFAGGYRLDFRPMTPREHADRKRERGEL